jgi:hypothetical protein
MRCGLQHKCRIGLTTTAETFNDEEKHLETLQPLLPRSPHICETGTATNNIQFY